MHCPVCATYNRDDAAVCRACGAPLGESSPGTRSDALPAGTRLRGGEFTLGRVLGQGGFGITYLGSFVSRRQAVAIKEFFPSGSIRHGLEVRPGSNMTPVDYLEAREKFLDEARMLTRFNHRGICRVYTVFEENNTAYMVMEYLKGKTLAKIIDERGPVPEREALGYGRDVGEALEVVHRQGVLHRDVKPENIILTDDGRVVLLDFGSARGFAAGKTRRMTALLTPGYAPLEQYAEQARRGPFTDVYALGATLYHLLTGQMPVQATDRATGVRLKPPSEVNPRVSPHVSEAVMWAMETRVDDRPQDVRSFLRALHAPGPRGSRAQPPAPVPVPRPRPRPRQAPPRQPPAEMLPGIPMFTLPWRDHCAGAVLGAALGAAGGTALLGVFGMLPGAVFGFIAGIALGRRLIYYTIVAALAVVGYYAAPPVARELGYAPSPWIRAIGVASGLLLGTLVSYIVARRWR